MPANINDYFTKASSGTRPSSTTLTAIKSIGAASISCGALTGWATDTAVHFVIYTTDSNGNKTAGSQTDWKGIVSGSTITGLELQAGTDTSYAVGSIVEAGPTAAWADDMVTGVSVGHEQTGLHKAFTETSIVPTAAIQNLAVTNAKLAADVSPVKFANPYKFSVYPSAALALTANVWTKAPLNTELFDTGNNFDSTTNYRFTAPIAGFYQFSGQITIGTGGISTGYGEGALYVNGAVKVYGNRQVGSGSATTIVRPRVDKLLQLAAGDYVELYGFCSEASRDIALGQEYTYLTGYLVSAT